MKRWPIAALAMTTVFEVFTCASAHADPAAADAAVAQAEASVKANEFANAAAKYREAYAADPRPELICNVGVAYVKAKDLPRAHLYLSRCLEHGTFDRTFMDAVHAAMSSIDGQLRTGEFTPIDIRVEPAGATISIAGFASDEAFVGGRVVWLPFGTHAISAAQSGYRPATVEITTTSHAAATANIVLEKQPEITVALPPPPPPPPPPLPHVELAVHVSKVPPIVASAVTLGAMVVAAIAIDLGRQRADLSQYAISTEVYAQDRDVVKRWNTVFAISGAAAIVGAGLGGFLWYRALRDATHLEVGASATAGGASIGVGARF